MKTKLLFLVLIALSLKVSAQDISTNRNPVGLEHNILFNANTRYNVNPSANNTLGISALFDGRFAPSYSSTAPTDANPYVIEITNLPNYHTQAGAWVGWSTRYWPASKFKIEGYNTHLGANQWVTIANIQNYTGSDFLQKCPAGIFSKLKFTFYSATGTSGYLGVSELYYINPEATQPYAGLYTPNSWKKSGTKVYYDGGNVGIGTTNATAPLTVAGKIESREVEVKIAAGADFVFNEDYPIKSLEEVEAFVKQNKHLPEIAPAAEMEANGLELGEMNIRLLQKVEELTLYLIEQNKKIKELESEIIILKEYQNENN